MNELPPPQSTHTASHAFIIRITAESVDGVANGAAWRGTIDDVSTGRRMYFSSFEGVIQFIREQTGVQPERPAPWWRVFWDRLCHDTPRKTSPPGS